MKIGKYARYYVIATQGIITMAALCVGGYFLGNWIWPDTLAKAILAIVGIILGLIIFIRSIFIAGGDDDRREE